MKRVTGVRRPGRSLPTVDAVLWETALRATARDPRTWGSVLHRLREAEQLSPGDQAAGLGVSMSGLILLSISRLPRPDHGDDDLAETADWVGVEVEVLRGLLAGVAGSRESRHPGLRT